MHRFKLRNVYFAILIANYTPQQALNEVVTHRQMSNPQRIFSYSKLDASL